MSTYFFLRLHYDKWKKELLNISYVHNTHTLCCICLGRWNKPDQRSVKDLLFESFGRPTMAKGLQDGLHAAAYDEKYGDFEFEEEEQNQQENPESMS